MTATDSGSPYLVIEDLTVKFPTADGLVTAVSDLSYSVSLGQTLGIVGESGSGKSVSSMAVLGLHDSRSAQISGSIRLGDTEIIGLSEDRLRQLRGNAAAMIFQDALAALHPFYKVGAQLGEAYQVHHPKASKKDARRKAIEMLDRVGIPQPDRRVDDYPHQFSGGMRQRAMIAMGLINDPSLLIADEPTTALDVTVQAQILDLLQDLQREFNSAIIIVTHDLGVIAEMADDVLVMYAGRAVEFGTCKEILTHPEMPYTWGLLSSIPDVTGDTDAKLIPIPGNPPSLLDPPIGLRVPSPVRTRRQGAGEPVRHGAAGADARRARSRPRQALSPGQPGRDLRGRSAAGDCPRAGGGGLMSDVNLDKPDATDNEPLPGQEDQVEPESAQQVASFAELADQTHAAAVLDVTAPPVLSVDNLKMYFPVKAGLMRRTVGHVQAVDGVSFQVPERGSLGLVGESGCGKSTTGRLITRLYNPTGGSMMFERPRPRPALPEGDEAAAARRADDLPGSLHLAEPPAHGRHDRGRPARGAQDGAQEADHPAGPGAARRSSGSTPSTTTATPTSSPAVSGSASASPGR